MSGTQEERKQAARMMAKEQERDKTVAALVEQVRQLRMTVERQGDRIRVLENQKKERDSLRVRVEDVCAQLAELGRDAHNARPAPAAPESKGGGGERLAGYERQWAEVAGNGGSSNSRAVADASSTGRRLLVVTRAVTRGGEAGASVGAGAGQQERMCVCGERHPPAHPRIRCFSCDDLGHHARCCTRTEVCRRCNIRHTPMPRNHTCHNCGEHGHRASCCDRPKRCGDCGSTQGQHARTCSRVSQHRQQPVGNRQQTEKKHGGEGKQAEQKARPSKDGGARPAPAQEAREHEHEHAGDASDSMSDVGDGNGKAAAERPGTPPDTPTATPSGSPAATYGRGRGNASARAASPVI
jgi:hypothetical protein